jgi:hypothetical protein
MIRDPGSFSGTRDHFASGNWEACTSQSKFELSHDIRLSSFVLPPELESKVLIFRKKNS